MTAPPNKPDVVFTSNNGFYLWAHDTGDKRGA
jgi:hypothetical protein